MWAIGTAISEQICLSSFVLIPSMSRLFFGSSDLTISINSEGLIFENSRSGILYLAGCPGNLLLVFSFSKTTHVYTNKMTSRRRYKIIIAAAGLLPH